MANGDGTPVPGGPEPSGGAVQGYQETDFIDSDAGGEDVGDEAQEGLLGTPEEGSEEEDWEKDGKKYRVHRDLKPHLMKDADYTQKTQEVAEYRRVMDFERQQLTQERAAQAQNLEVVGKIYGAAEQIRTIDQQLAAYDKVNWAQLEEQNPAQAASVLRKFTQLKGLRDQWTTYQGQLAGIFRNTEARRQYDAAQERAKRLYEGNQYLAKHIKDWSEEKGKKLLQFAHTIGLPAATIAKLEEDAHAVRILNDAYEAEQLRQRQKAAASSREQGAPVPAPTTQVARARSAAPPATLDDRLNINAWMARRNAQVRKLGRR